MATRIQAHWRGYASRRYIHDFYQRKKYIDEIVRTNDATRLALTEAERRDSIEQLRIAEEAQRRAINAKLDQMHHLLSTATLQGALVNQRSQDLVADLQGRSLEEAVRDHHQRSPVKMKRDCNGETFGKETIRVAGDYDHLREERDLQRRVEKRLIAMQHPKPFSSTSKAKSAWNPLTTFSSDSLIKLTTKERDSTISA